MKGTITVVCAGALALSGCMHTYDLTRNPPELDQDRVNADLAGDEWTIRKLDGATTKVRITNAGPDSIWYLDAISRTPGAVSRDDIAAISCSPGYGGPIVGFLGGGFLGAWIGSMIGVSQPVPNNLAGGFEAIGNTAEGGIYGALLGAPIGLIIGGELSAGKEYVFNTHEQIRRVQIDTTIVIGRNDFLSQSTTSITFLWGGRERTVPISVIKVTRRGEQISIGLPRAYLYR